MRKVFIVGMLMLIAGEVFAATRMLDPVVTVSKYEEIRIRQVIERNGGVGVHFVSYSGGTTVIWREEGSWWFNATHSILFSVDGQVIVSPVNDWTLKIQEEVMQGRRRPCGCK